MYVIYAANVRDALPKAVRYILQFGDRESTRLGDAWVSRTPVTIRYQYPKQHVLINRIRDANPFFHLMEAMWMLAGRNDGAFLDYYIKDFSKKFGNPDGIIHDAYGYRWREGLGYDQLGELIDQLKKTPNTRQAVLQMWGAGVDDLSSEYSKPCNLTAAFRIFHGKLNMIVYNRSNDLIWGCCGANAVHFAILQEYIAGMIGIDVGEYWQVSNNLHMYQEHVEMLEKRLTGKDKLNLYVALKNDVIYENTVPLVQYPREFDEELQEIMNWLDGLQHDQDIYDGNISNPFLRDVVIPMAKAHYLYKGTFVEHALREIERVAAEDWQRAGKEWIERRMAHDTRRSISV